MPSVSKNVYTGKLADAVNEYNKTYHSAIKIKVVDVNSSTYTDFNVKNNSKNSKFKIIECIRISKYQNMFAKGHIPN